MKKYEWNRRLAPIEADVVGEELERIRSKTGQLVPADVVSAARPKKSPIHAAFEWDDTLAGEKYRIHQARNIIRAVRVVSEGDDGESVSHPQFVHINRGHEDQYYQSAEVAVENVDEFVLAVNGLANKVAGAQRALDDLRAMAEGRGSETLALLACAASALATARESISRVN